MNTTTWKTRYPDLDDAGFSWFLPNENTNNPPDLWLDWLLDPGSLTSRLRHLSKGDFQVEVLEENWAQPDQGQLDMFNLPEEEIWSRRVLLRGFRQPWVVAHTSIPKSSMDSPLKKVLDLNEKPLGELLFIEKDMSRGPIYICKTKTGWGRRSKFFLYQQPLVVAEYFLESFIKTVSENK